MNQAVTLDIENGIADLRLNRPDKMNAVDENIMTGQAFNAVPIVFVSPSGAAH